MPTAKLGQVSSNAINDVQQKHWDAMMRIREFIDVLTLDEKLKLIAKMPSVIDGIKSEMRGLNGDDG